MTPDPRDRRGDPVAWTIAEGLTQVVRREDAEAAALERDARADRLDDDTPARAPAPVLLTATDQSVGHGGRER